MRHPHKLVLCLFAAALVLAVSACGPKTPEEKIAAARAQYSVKLESFSVEEPEPEPAPIEEMMDAEGEEGMAAEAATVAAEAAAAGEEMAEEVAEEMEEMTMNSVPRTVDVILHMLVRFSGTEPLPGITVEVTQADPFGQEGEPTLHWIDTAGMTKSDVKQVDLRLEGVEFEDGDAFSVLLRSDVPPEARSGYREFAETGSS